MPPVEVFQFRATEYRSGATTLNTGDAIYAFKTVEQPEVSRKTAGYDARVRGGRCSELERVFAEKT